MSDATDDTAAAAPAPSAVGEAPPSQLASIEEQLKQLAESVGTLRSEHRQIRMENRCTDAFYTGACKTKLRGRNL